MSPFCDIHKSYFDGEECNACHMLKSDNRCCANCLYSDMQLRCGNKLQCKRHAPIVGTYKTQGGLESEYPRYPLVNIDHLCGDYRSVISNGDPYGSDKY